MIGVNKQTDHDYFRLIDPDLCRTYPEKLVVLLCIPDVDLIRGASIYQEGRFPTACWMDPVTESVLLRAAATVSERYVIMIIIILLVYSVACVN